MVVWVERIRGKHSEQTEGRLTMLNSGARSEYQREYQLKLHKGSRLGPGVQVRAIMPAAGGVVN